VLGVRDAVPPTQRARNRTLTMGVSDIAAILRRNKRGPRSQFGRPPYNSELVHAHGACFASMKHSAGDRLVQRNTEFPGERRCTQARRASVANRPQALGKQGVDAVALVAITCRSSMRDRCRRGGTEWRVRSVASCPSSMVTNRCGPAPQRGAGASPVTARGPHGGITDRVRRPRADPTGASTSSRMASRR
jgi:hypothetical protein